MAEAISCLRQRPHLQRSHHQQHLLSLTPASQWWLQLPTLPYARRYPNRISAAGSSSLETDVVDLILPGMRTMRAIKVVYASHLAMESAGPAASMDTCSTNAHSNAWAVAAVAVAAVLVVVALGLTRFGMGNHPTRTLPTPIS